MLKAVTRQATAVDTKIQQLSAGRETAMSTAYFFDHHATPADLAVVVTEEDFFAAQQELVPSVSAGELAHYEKVRAAFEGTSSSGSNGKKADMKGKGKAPALAVEDVDGDVDGRRKRKDKGKGKAVTGFQDGTASDDDGLY
jgi:peroxin-6